MRAHRNFGGWNCSSTCWSCTLAAEISAQNPGAGHIRILAPWNTAMSSFPIRRNTEIFFMIFLATILQYFTFGKYLREIKKKKLS